MNQKTTALLNDQFILAAFRHRDLPAPPEDAVAAALRDDRARQWLLTHLGPDSFLSQEELDLHACLTSSSPSEPTTRPFLDAELANAVETLEESTSISHTRTNVLKQQCHVLREEMQEGELANEKRAKTLKLVNERHARELQRVESSVENSIDDIDLILKPLQAEVDAETNALIPQGSSLLREDDRILELLESCVGEDESMDNATDDEGEDSARTFERVRKLTELLKRFTEEAIHRRLDRVFLESALPPARRGGAVCERGSSFTGGNNEEDPTTLLQGVEQEMASLCPDIGALVDMGVEHEYGKPLPSAIRAAVTQRQRRIDEGINLAQKTLEELVTSLTQLVPKLQDRQSFSLTLYDFMVRYNDEIKSCEPVPLIFSDTPQTHHHDRAKSTGRLTPASARACVSLPEDPSIRSEQDKLSGAWDPFLSRYNLSVSQLFDPLRAQDEGETEGAAITDSLQKHKMANLLNALPTLGSASMSTLASYLVSLDSANQLLTDALFKDAKFEPTLINKKEHATLTQLDHELEKVRKALDGLCMDSLYGKDLKREKFMERWAGGRGAESDGR